MEEEHEKVFLCLLIWFSITPSYKVNLFLFNIFEFYMHRPCQPYGFEIVQTVIVDAEPDEHVKRTMSEINACKCSF